MKASILRIRVRKEDSAFIYNVLESSEGVASYSTLPFTPGELHRDLELTYSPDFDEELRDILQGLGDKVYILE